MTYSDNILYPILPSFYLLFLLLVISYHGMYLWLLSNNLGIYNVKFMADSHSWSITWVLEQPDRIVMFTQVVADVEGRYSTYIVVEKGHDWVVHLVNNVVELVDLWEGM